MATTNSSRAGGLPAGVPERYQRLLAMLVRAFIEHGEPVSSLWLARESGLDVSSATVRNVLARLEELGYVRQPHTSAGRVPTDQGYRFYVDLLLESRRPSRAVHELTTRLRRAGGMGELLENVSQELSRASHHLGIDVHDCAQARNENYRGGELKPGMVITVEPGLYFKGADLMVPEELRGIGVRIEDDIVITEDGCEILSAHLPRHPDEVEAWIAGIWSRD